MSRQNGGKQETPLTNENENSLLDKSSDSVRALLEGLDNDDALSEETREQLQLFSPDKPPL